MWTLEVDLCSGLQGRQPAHCIASRLLLSCLLAGFGQWEPLGVGKGRSQSTSLFLLAVRKTSGNSRISSLATSPPWRASAWLLGEEGQGDHHSSSSSVLDSSVLSGSGHTTSQLPLLPRGENEQPSSHSNFLLLLISKFPCLCDFSVAPSPV